MTDDTLPKLDFNAITSDGNIFVMSGQFSRLAKDAGWPTEAREAVFARVTASYSYDEAVAVLMDACNGKVTPCR